MKTESQRETEIQMMRQTSRDGRRIFDARTCVCSRHRERERERKRGEMNEVIGLCLHRRHEARVEWKKQEATTQVDKRCPTMLH